MIKIDWTIVLQVANFFILIGVLQRVFFRPMRAVMEQRRKTWEGMQQQADNLMHRLEEKMDRDRQRVQEVRIMLEEERAAVRRELAVETARRLQTAEKRAAQLLQEVREQIRQEKDRTRACLQEQTEVLVEGIVRKVIGRSF